MPMPRSQTKYQTSWCISSKARGRRRLRGSQKSRGIFSAYGSRSSTMSRGWVLQEQLLLTRENSSSIHVKSMPDRPDDVACLPTVHHSNRDGREQARYLPDSLGTFHCVYRRGREEHRHSAA